MVKVDQAFEVRYFKDRNQFEVLVDFDKLREFKEKPEELSVYDVLADQKIFRDQKKGELASGNVLEQVFQGLGEEQVLKEILLKGECQIPTSYLNQLREEKKKQVVNYIVENAINGVTKTKFTPSMIESAISKLKFNFDPNSGFEHQAEEVVKILRREIPISMERVIMKIEIPGIHSGAFYGLFRKFGRVIKEYFDNSGNMHIHMEISESQIDKVASYIKEKSNLEGSYHIAKD